MGKEQGLFFVDNFDGTKVVSDVLPDDWLEVDPETQLTFLKHPNMRDYREDGALGVLLSLGDKISDKAFKDRFNWRDFIDERLDAFMTAITDLITLWDSRPLPVADFTVAGTLTVGSSITLDSASSTGYQIPANATFLWSLPAGATITVGTKVDASITVTFGSTGDKDVTLKLTDVLGRVSTKTKVVTITT